jgi:hypothetical protein
VNVEKHKGRNRGKAPFIEPYVERIALSHPAKSWTYAATCVATCSIKLAIDVLASRSPDKQGGSTVRERIADFGVSQTPNP